MFSEDFTAFYKAYPRKRNPGQAWKTWQKLEKSIGLDLKVLIDAIEAQKKEWVGKYGSLKSEFIPHPSTWLNALAWMNEVDDEANVGVVKESPGERAARIRFEAEADQGRRDQAKECDRSVIQIDGDVLGQDDRERPRAMDIAFW